MKKLSLFFITCLLYASFAWADVSVTETYQTMPNISSSETKSLSKEMETSSGLSSQGTLAVWQYRRVRAKKTDTIAKNTRAFLFDRSCDINRNPYLQCTTWEGGIKNVHFNWKQVSADDDGQLLKIQVMLKDNAKAVPDITENINVEAGETYRESTQSFTSTGLDLKVNSGQLIIYNLSRTHDDDAYAAGRILVGPITVTPYLLYRNKDVTIGLKQHGYANDGAQDFINNTGGEGSITYSSDDTSIATVDEENGVITPVGVGTTTITATWSEGASTTYTLHVVDGIIAENFSKVVQTGQTTGADWHGDLWDWTVANVRRGVDDTLGLVPRIQATAMRSNAGSTIISANAIEGGVKHLTFDWRQWASGTTPLTIDMYYSSSKDTWGDAVATQSEDAVGASTPHSFSEDIDDGAKGNAYLKLNYTSGAGVAVLGALKITPWLLYTTKEATMDTRGSGAMSYKNMDLINNTGSTVTYSIENYGGIPTDKIGIASDGTVTVTDRYQTGDITVQAAWSAVTTTYTLHVIGKASANASFEESEKNVDRTILVFSNVLSKADGSGDATYESSNTGVADVGETTGSITINGVGTTVITATIAENDNFQGAVVSYTLNVTATTVASYQSSEIHATLGEAIPVNELSYTIGYDGVISYASTVPAVADFEAGVLTLKAPGQTKITVTLPATSNYTAATASYILTVSYSNYEAFEANTTEGWYVKPEQERMGDVCKWYAYICGIKTPDYFSSNAITTRAPRTEENQGYVKSAKISGGISALAFNYSMMFAETDIENWDIHIYINDRLVGQLTNEAGGDLDGINGRTLNPMRTKVITGINEPGSFIIRFENHSTVKSEVEYTEGNKGRFAIDNVSWENYDAPIVLNETADNSAILTVNNGETVDVNTNRSLVADVWNTLCLPFDIDKSDLGADVDVQVMSSAVIDGEDLTVGFRALSGNTLVAGTPYLVKPTSAVSLTGFTDKQITATPGTITQGTVTLTGIFSPTTLTANDKTTLFVGTPDGEGNNLFYPGETGDLKGMRAYFKLSTPSGAPTLRRARFIVNEAQSPTALDEADNALQSSRKVLENGHLFIIRDGKKYNVTGQKIQ